jgi:hypothetical protein
MNLDTAILARRAAMLREATDALPTGRERDALLVQMYAIEEQLRAAAFKETALFAQAAE